MSNTKFSKDQLLHNMSKILVPEEFLIDFEVCEIKDLTDEWQIVLFEKSDRIPIELKDKLVVLDGFCNCIDIMTHAISLKKIFLKIYRRRWKEKGTTIHFSNTYDLHPKGMKTTRLFRDFLKEITR